MRMRRKRGAHEATGESDSALEQPEADLDAAEDSDDGAPDGPQEDPRANGPWDIGEHPVDPDDETRAHLGCLSVEGHSEVEVQLQVDEDDGGVVSVMLVGKDGAMELRPFAAPRGEDIWEDVRSQLAQQAGRMGGRAGDVDGPYGTALHLQLPATTPEGEQVVQPSTVLGISGPRWLLRVSMFGRPAVEYHPDAPLESTLRSVVVDRGNEPMVPGAPLRFVLPPTARRMES